MAPPEAATSRLLLPRWDRPVILHCDSSGVEVGAVLQQQLKGDSEERPVAFASKEMTAAEIKCPVFEQEGLAVVFWLRCFNHYAQRTSPPT